MEAQSLLAVYSKQHTVSIWATRYAVRQTRRGVLEMVIAKFLRAAEQPRVTYALEL